MVLLVAINGIMARLEKTKKYKPKRQWRHRERSYFRCYQTLWSVRMACLLCGRPAVGKHVTAWRAAASCLGFTVPGARCACYECKPSSQLGEMDEKKKTHNRGSMYVCQRLCSFHPAAEASLHPDWSCCTTSTLCTTTSPHVSPPLYCDLFFFLSPLI